MHRRSAFGEKLRTCVGWGKVRIGESGFNSPHIEFEDVDGDARERAGPGEPDEVAGADVGGKKGRPDLRDC